MIDACAASGLLGSKWDKHMYLTVNILKYKQSFNQMSKSPRKVDSWFYCRGFWREKRRNRGLMGGALKTLGGVVGVLSCRLWSSANLVIQQHMNSMQKEGGV